MINSVERIFLKLRKMEISKLEKFYSTVFFTISHTHSAFGVEYFYVLKM